MLKLAAAYTGAQKIGLLVLSPSISPKRVKRKTRLTRNLIHKRAPFFSSQWFAEPRLLPTLLTFYLKSHRKTMIIQARASVLIAQPEITVFEYIAINFFENYPRWSPEVVELEALTPGPLRLGTQARQVRIDVGRRTESTFQIVAYQAARRIGFESLSSPFYRARYDLEPVNTGTRLTFAFEVHLGFIYTPFEPLITASMKAGSERVVHHLKRLLEPETRWQPEWLATPSYESRVE
jgi:hypothetical protein